MNDNIDEDFEKVFGDNGEEWIDSMSLERLVRVMNFVCPGFSDMSEADQKKWRADFQVTLDANAAIKAGESTQGILNSIMRPKK